MSKHASEFDNFNTAMDAILRANPKAVREAMGQEKRQNAEQRAARLCFDDSRLREQMRDLWQELEVQFPHKFGHHLVSVLGQLSADIVIGKRPSTLRAGRGKKVVIACFFGSRYDDLLAAIRTGELNRVTHAFDSLRALSSSGPASDAKD